MYKVKIYVTYQESILDPQGEAIKTALHRLNYQAVKTVTVGKYFEMIIEDHGQNVETEVERMSDELLANVNMETYRFEIERVEE
jgi:phosphoribosylformylglycinamidine synthase PurS subunit